MSKQDMILFNDSIKLVEELSDKQKAAFMYQLAFRSYIIQQEILKGHIKEFNMKEVFDKILDADKDDIKKIIEESVDENQAPFLFFYNRKDQPGKIQTFYNTIAFYNLYPQMFVNQHDIQQYAKEFDNIQYTMQSQGNKEQDSKE